MTTWVIGNGESRSPIDINTLQGTTIGCNAIFRDYKTNHLICVDKRMMNEALEHGANNHSLLYTRKDWYPYYNSDYKRIRLVPELPYAGSERHDDPWHWGSGPFAVLLGAKQDSKVINLIGFDLYSKTNKVNNIYKDTLNYDAAEKRAVDPRYWIYQVGKVFECFTKKNFVIYQDEDWQIPKNWKYSNVKVDNINNIS